MPRLFALPSFGLPRHVVRLGGLVAILVLSTHSAAALSPDLAVSQFTLRSWQTDHGLPQNSVRDLAQTPDGYLWIATQAGLARFDGVRFTVFRERDGSGLPGDQVSSLAVDADGALWVGTQAGLAMRRDGELNPVDPLGDGQHWPIRSLATDSAGLLCAGTDRHGVLQRSAAGTWRLIGPSQGLPLGDYRTMAADGQGGCWAGSVGGGLFHLSPHGVRAVELPTNFIWSVFQGRDGVLWIGTDSGLIRWHDGVTRILTRRDGLQQDRVGAVLEDRDGNVWIGTQGGGVSRWNDRGLDSLEPRDQASGPVIWTLLEDREGNIWFGSLSRGLSRLEEGPFVHYGLREGIASLQVHAVIEAPRGGVFLATNSGGVHHLAEDGSVRRWTTADGLSDNTAWSLTIDLHDRLWIGTGNQGVDCLDADGRVHHLRQADGLPGHRVLAVLADRQRRLWVGTNAGLAVFALHADGSVVPSDIAVGTIVDPGVAVMSLANGRGGRIWIGTQNGLVAVDPDGSVRQYPPGENGLPTAPIWSVTEEADGQVWIGTYGGGLVAFDGWKFQAITSADGLPSDDITAVITDGVGHLWLASTNGLVRCPRDALVGYLAGRLELPQFRIFDRLDGLRSAESYGGLPIGTRTSDGALWFASLAGAIRVDPRQVAAPRPAPEVLIEAVTVDGEAWDPPFPETLGAGVREVSIRYTAATLTASQRIRFRYRLSGFTNLWTYAGSRREAFFTNLRPGQYRFEVQASDDLGRFRDQHTFELAFTVVPRFVDTPSFVALVALGLVLLGFAIQQLRVRRLRAREEELQRVADEAVANVRTLRGLMPICASCKKIRDDEGYWNQLEVFLDQHSEAQLSHGLCPSCVDVYAVELDQSEALTS